MKSRRIWRGAVSLGLIACMSCPLALLYSLAFRPQRDISEIEQRRLERLPRPSLADFLRGDYQRRAEDAIADQLLYSAEIKFGVKQCLNAMTRFFSASLGALEGPGGKGGPEPKLAGQKVQASGEGRTRPPTPSPSPRLRPSPEAPQSPQSQRGMDAPLGLVGGKASPSIGQDGQCQIGLGQDGQGQSGLRYTEVVAGKIYKLDDSGYLVQRPVPPEDFSFDLYDQAMLGRVRFPKYLYFINTSVSSDFSRPLDDAAFERVKSHFSMDGYAQFSFSSFAEYKRYFYQTDHHWNYRGSYLGYCQMLRLLEGPQAQPLLPEGEHEYPAIYNGSLSRDNLLRLSTERFTVYLFNLPKYHCFVDDLAGAYGFRHLYISDSDFPHKLYSNHYGMYYGDDHAKVVYTQDMEKGQGLLVLATSFSNAVNELLAAHYRETHVLDFRYYRRRYGEDIDAQSYMERNRLDKLLIIGDIASLGRERRR